MPELTPSILSAIFQQEPKAAIAFLQAKGFKIGWNWFDNLGQDIHDRVFTVAKVARVDILQNIHDALGLALKTGQTERQFIADLEPVLRAQGWWGRKVVVDSQGGAEVVQEGSLYRLKTIYRTNLQSAYMAGREQSMREAVDSHPYWQIVGVDDARTRPAHAAMHGKVFRYDDPLYAAIGHPPWGFNCRCRLSPMSEASMARRGVTPSTAEGRLKSITVEAGVDKRTGEIIEATRTGLDVRGHNGKTLFFAPDAGFGKDWKPDPRLYDADLAKLIKKNG